MRMNLKRGLVVAGVATVVAASWTALPSAGEAGSSARHAASARQVVRVHGTQVPVDPDNGKYAMRGGLRGKWLVVSAKVLHASPTLFISSGKERFRGCLDENRDKSCQGREPSGALRFAYLYWASFDHQGNLIRGQCVHPISGGTDAFAGARGVLRMVDHPVAGGVRTTYAGKVVLKGASARAATASRALAAPGARTSVRPTRLAC